MRSRIGPHLLWCSRLGPNFFGRVQLGSISSCAPDLSHPEAGGRARIRSDVQASCDPKCPPDQTGPVGLLADGHAPSPSARLGFSCYQLGVAMRSACSQTFLVIPTWKMSCSKSPQMLPIMRLPHWCSHTCVTNMDARVKVLPGAPIMYGCSRARPVPVHAPIATPPDRHRVPAAPPSSENTQ